MLFASNPYPPYGLGLRWPLLALGFFVAVIGGYFLISWIRRRLALRRQRQLIELSKPKKDEIIARALQEIDRLQTAVQAGQMTIDAGAAQISLTARTAFDALMNHRTAYAAKYEVAERRLQKVEMMLTTNYPVLFSDASKKDRAAFVASCNQAREVVASCR